MNLIIVQVIQFARFTLIKIRCFKFCRVLITGTPRSVIKLWLRSKILKFGILDKNWIDLIVKDEVVRDTLVSLGIRIRPRNQQNSQPVQCLYKLHTWLLAAATAICTFDITSDVAPWANHRSLQNICIATVLSVTEMFLNMLVGTTLKSIIPACSRLKISMTSK